MTAISNRQIVTKEDREPEGAIFTVKLVAGLLIFGIGLILVLSETYLGWIMGTLVIGVMYTHAIELEHQCLHNTAYKSKQVNRFIGRLLGAPSLVSYTHYQVKHHWHHRWTGTKMDSEFFRYRPSERGLSVTTLLKSAFCYERYVDFTKAVFNSLRNPERLVEVPITKTKLQMIRREYLCLASMVILTFLIAILAGQLWVLMSVWVIPLILVTEPVHYLIETPEHYGCDRIDSSGYCNTRSISSGRILNWLLNGNNYHVEHHLYPNVAMSRLSIIHKKIKHNLVHHNESYLEFFMEALDVVERTSRFGRQEQTFEIGENQ